MHLANNFRQTVLVMNKKHQNRHHKNKNTVISIYYSSGVTNEISKTSLFPRRSRPVAGPPPGGPDSLTAVTSI